jgi:hypothetical protein
MQKLNQILRNHLEKAYLKVKAEIKPTPRLKIQALLPKHSARLKEIFSRQNL